MTIPEKTVNCKNCLTKSECFKELNDSQLDMIENGADHGLVHVTIDSSQTLAFNILFEVPDGHSLCSCFRLSRKLFIFGFHANHVFPYHTIHIALPEYTAETIYVGFVRACND